MVRVVTVWWPDWPIIAAGHHDQVAAVIAANRVVASSPTATSRGVTVGQRRRAAQQCCPDLILLDADEDRDARAFEPLVRAISADVPRVEVSTPGRLRFDVKGPARYFGGEERFLQRLRDHLANTTGTFGVGCADGRFASTLAAWQAAHRNSTLTVPPGSSPQFLAGLPVSWLTFGDPPTTAAMTPAAVNELVDLLGRLGITHLGGITHIGEADMLARFGHLGVWAHRLASGDGNSPLDTSEPPADWAVAHTFEPPVVQLDPIVFAAKALADQLADLLETNGTTCTRLLVEAETDHSERSERTWYRPSGMSAAAMVERVRWQLDGWVNQPGGLTAGVVLLRLRPEEIRSNDGQQHTFWGGPSEHDGRARRAIARLTTIVGDPNVTVAAWAGGRLIDERYQWLPAATADLEDPQPRLQDAEPDRQPPWPGALPSPHPTVIHPDPRPVDVVDADGQPVQVTGRGEVSATPTRLNTARITAWSGPWPVDQRWWHHRRRLARFQVVLDNGQACLLTVERQRWWLTAEYR